ncbi:hypothetical protein GA0111570_10455 [Raineyella antarctica]|uniref:Uncharacterized protein n=1 Tax=Raineyella antarctica TaxID=1577474 RepID=A0A1G6GNT2_9ACTN|nr:hypothetical protein [Raineyella antarctica]SDB82846.1 hypothetical protein GA0111570_10455 [Raineyella antarctica]
MPALRQPWLGIAASVLIIVLSLVFISPFSAGFFGGWLAFVLMCMIPFAIVVGAFWHGEEPAPLARLRQPVRGIAYLLTAAVIGAIVALLLWSTVGGRVGPPLPMLSMATILSVTVSFFMVIVFGGWPFSLIPNRLAAGLALLVGVYVVAIGLFVLLANFDFLKGAPIYRADLDPQGPFDAWGVIVVAVTALALMFLVLHFDLWPLTRSAGLMKQPVLGVVWTLGALVLAVPLYQLGIRGLGMTPPAFLVSVPIPFIFGSVVMLNMLQGSAFAKLPQPAKGVASAVVAAVVGSLLALLYRALMPLVTGDMPAGPPTFDAELWLANALLAVTFPFLAFYGDFFQLWPLARGGAEPETEPANGSLAQA